MARHRHREHRASRLVARLRRRLGEGTTTVGEIVTHFGDRATAFMLLILAIPALIPSPGIPLGFFFGAAMALVAIQIMAGVEHVRLPGFIARHRFSSQKVEVVLRRAVPLLQRLERHLKPRLQGMARMGPALAVLIFLHGVVILLPIPLGNTLPGLAVILIALGLIARDGAAVIVGLIVSAAAIAFAVAMVLAAIWLTQAAVGT